MYYHMKHLLREQYKTFKSEQYGGHHLFKDLLKLIVMEHSQLDDTNQDVISSIIKMSKSAKMVYWNHVFRKVNSAADGLAKHGLTVSRLRC